jgi:hypothetical protein
MYRGSLSRRVGQPRRSKGYHVEREMAGGWPTYTCQDSCGPKKDSSQNTEGSKKKCVETLTQTREEGKAMNLSRVIRQWRWAEKFSIRQAAPMVGISRNALFRLEHEKAIDASNLAQVIRWLLFSR